MQLRKYEISTKWNDIFSVLFAIYIVLLFISCHVCNNFIMKRQKGEYFYAVQEILYVQWKNSTLEMSSLNNLCVSFLNAGQSESSQGKRANNNSIRQRKKVANKIKKKRTDATAVTCIINILAQSANVTTPYKNKNYYQIIKRK